MAPGLDTGEAPTGYGRCAARLPSLLRERIEGASACSGIRVVIPAAPSVPSVRRHHPNGTGNVVTDPMAELQAEKSRIGLGSTASSYPNAVETSWCSSLTLGAGVVNRRGPDHGRSMESR
jgi:hypothetical protein